ncbi:hypothetical protein N431DRAFT_174978 [Stipitochalara longipes BDJ]|nr:hypothetical protein N431DRAFT_174978 [Stipitochalara longipes BDJ]
MASQYPGYPYEEVDVKLSPNSALVVTPGYQMHGGLALDRVSNTSTDSQSQPSFSDDHCFPPNTPSPISNMSSYPLFYGSNPVPSQQYDSSYGSFQQTEVERHTPTSLNWGLKSADFVKLYKFIVPKGKLPYLELLENWTPTYQTPYKVYLDEQIGFKKSQFPCQFPGTCNGKQNVFSRPADLERHYKNVHASNKDAFPCDYAKCPRSQDPFTRKDHYRDHLRDFHKEDIGAAKGEKLSGERNKQKWQKAQKIWLAERNISHRYWRCAKCLVKNYVIQQGFECSSCKNLCEEDRANVRRKLASERQTPEDPSEITIADTTQYAAPYCGTCNDSTYLDNGNGAYVPCHVCQPAPVQVQYPYASSYGDIPYN